MSIRSRRWEKREMQAGKLVGMTFGILLLLTAIAVQFMINGLVLIGVIQGGG